MEGLIIAVLLTMTAAVAVMVGEESVTLDTLPLSLAVADEGRLEEVVYLSSFALEEAKHVDFFRRWFDDSPVTSLPMAIPWR